MSAIQPRTPTPAATDLDLHQTLFNALSVAQWHLARGEPERALGRVLSVSRRLKVVASERKGGQDGL